MEGEIEPCGCRTNPLGGIHRRFSAIPKNALLLITGDTFYRHNPLPLGLEKSSQTKAETLAKATAATGGYKILTPGFSDFAEGLESFKKLSRTANVEVVLSNIKGFSRKKILEEQKMVIFGYYSESLPEPFPGANIPQGLSWIKEESKTARGEGLLSIVLTNQPFDEAENTFSGVADIVITGGDATLLNTATVLGETDQTIFLSAFYGGQYVGSFSADRWDGHSRQWVENSQQEQAQAQVNYFTTREEQIKDALEEKGLSDQAKTLLQAELKTAKDEKARWRSLTSSQKIPFKFEQIPMDTRWEARDNSVYRLLQDHRIHLNETGAQMFPAAKMDRMARSDLGPISCQKCHEPQFQFWKNTMHSSAIIPLWNKASQNNSECLQCHSIGLGTHWGIKEGPFEKGTESFTMESVLGKITDINQDIDFHKQRAQREQLHKTYWATLDPMKLNQNFVGVSCTHCHGEPPTDHEKTSNWPNKVSTQTCLGCHNKEQSARFYDERGVLNQQTLQEYFTKMSCPKSPPKKP